MQNTKSETENLTVEVFKTNIESMTGAALLKRTLLLHYPDSRINFDLEDCDNILRIEGENIDIEKVERLSKMLGYTVSELPD